MVRGICIIEEILSLKYETHIGLRYDKKKSLFTMHRRHGRWHRLDGPAILWNDGDPPEWYFYGKWDEEYGIGTRSH
jgi:hypothetical protein